MFPMFISRFIVSFAAADFEPSNIRSIAAGGSWGGTFASQQGDMRPITLAIASWAILRSKRTLEPRSA
jgi:hypothetical protein